MYTFSCYFNSCRPIKHYIRGYNIEHSFSGCNHTRYNQNLGEQYNNKVLNSHYLLLQNIFFNAYFHVAYKYFLFRKEYTFNDLYSMGIQIEQIVQSISVLLYICANSINIWYCLIFIVN